MLAMAQLPCMQEQLSQGWGRTGLQHSPAGPRGHAATQPVIFKPQTLSSAVISLSPPARPRGWPSHGSPVPADQGLPAQQPAWTGEKGAECPPCPAGSHEAWAAAAGRIRLPRLCRHLQDWAARAAGTRGRGHLALHRPPCCRKTAWLQLTNSPKLIRALQMCCHPGQPRSQPEPSREGKVHLADWHPQLWGSKSGLRLSKSCTSPDVPLRSMGQGKCTPAPGARPAPPLLGGNRVLAGQVPAHRRGIALLHRAPPVARSPVQQLLHGQERE